jgi:hypothetical protein
MIFLRKSNIIKEDIFRLLMNASFNIHKNDFINVYDF